MPGEKPRPPGTVPPRRRAARVAQRARRSPGQVVGRP
ncbi:hypothetical protein [Microbacterium thalli]